MTGVAHMPDIQKFCLYDKKVLKVAVPGLDSRRGFSTQPGFLANDYIAIVPVRAVGVMAAWAVPLEFSARK